jgi:hypothetical protein
MTLPEALAQILFALGVGFLVANLLKAVEILNWWRRRSTALLVWPGRKPPYYGLMLGIAMMLGVLIIIKGYVVGLQFTDLRGWDYVRGWVPAFLRRAFGELMMFVYYGYMLPLSTRIARGLYADGVWTDTGFMPYSHIGGISWRDGQPPSIVIISSMKTLARRLEVPVRFLGELRRVLRDKIASHAIEMGSGPGLHLGDRDARDSV